MKQLETYIIEKLKVSLKNVYYKLGLNIFDNVKSENDFYNNVNVLLNTLLDISENIYDGQKPSNNQDSNKYIVIVKSESSAVIFLGDNSKDDCFLILYNTTSLEIMLTRLKGNINKFIPTGNDRSDIYLFKLDNELNDLLKYCEKNAI
jgi:hypothetical protein